MTPQSSCEVSGVCVSPVLCLAAPLPASVSVPGRVWKQARCVQMCSLKGILLRLCSWAHVVEGGDPALKGNQGAPLSM